MAEIKQSDIPNQAKRKKSLGIFIVILLILSIACALYWFFFLKDFEETEDAYVGGNQVMVSSSCG